MRRALPLFVGLLFLAVSLQAQESRLSLVVETGPAFVTGPKAEKDVASWGWYGGAELMYRLNDNWGLIPLSLSYTRLSVDKDKFGTQLGGTVSDASMSALMLAPAIQVNTDPERAAMGFFQLGAGWARTMSDVTGSVGGVAFDEDSKNNDFLLFLGGGIESKIAERVALLGKLKYWIIFNEEDNVADSGNTNGLNLGLGLRIYF